MIAVAPRGRAHRAERVGAGAGLGEAERADLRPAQRSGQIFAALEFVAVAIDVVEAEIVVRDARRAPSHGSSGRTPARPRRRRAGRDPEPPNSCGTVTPKKPCAPIFGNASSGHHSSASIRALSGYSSLRAKRSASSRMTLRSASSSHPPGRLAPIAWASWDAKPSLPLDVSRPLVAATIMSVFHQRSAERCQFPSFAEGANSKLACRIAPL